MQEIFTIVFFNIYKKNEFDIQNSSNDEITNSKRRKKN